MKHVKILQNICSQALAQIHLDRLVADEFPINRGARQGDPLSPKLFIAVMEEVFKKADIFEGINVDRENLTNLRFADDDALFTDRTKQNNNKKKEKHLNSLNSESLKVSPEIQKGKTKYVTNHADSEAIY